MAPTEALFAVVICSGSYHTPEPYQPFINALKSRGIEAYCPQLPSADLSKLNVGDIRKPDYERDPPAIGYPQPADDAVVLEGLLNTLIDAGKYVLVLGHSSGGFAATYVSIPKLQAKVRKVEGKAGGIIGIFYEAAFLIPFGESMHSFFQPKDGSDPIIPPYSVIHSHGFDGLLSTKESAKYFFNGMDDAAAQYYEATLTAFPVFTTVLGNDAYSSLPCAYLVTVDDFALPALYQEGMVAMQTSRPGVNMTVYKAPCGHSPHLQWTEGLVEKVHEFGRSLI
ncbi:MAG: hypothetical protein M1821_003486 [Bathelium mastoideum]|nr:MAG: hypothetical protein M1821_003486 [Bathelium mastoideum]